MPRVASRHDLSPLQVVRLFENLAPDSRMLDSHGQRRTGVHFGECVWIVDEAPDPGLLARAWQLVVNRHPVLRSCFTWEDIERPARVVYDSVDSAPQWLDWRGLGPAARQVAFAGLIEEQYGQPPRLDEAPLVRLCAIRTGTDQFRVVLVTHELLLDDRSVAAVADDLLACYRMLRASGSATVRARPDLDPYLARLASQGLEDTEAFWRAELRGLRGPALLKQDPGEVPRPDESGRPVTSLTVPFTLETEPARRLRALAAEAGLQLETVFVGAWALLISRHHREPDVLVGYDVPGRAHGDVELADALGAFRNVVPLRVAVDERVRILDWLADLQRRRAAVQPHEYVPEALVREWSEVPRTDVLLWHRFAYREAAASPSGTAGGLPVRREAALDVPPEALGVRIDDTGSGFDGLAVYRADQFEPGHVASMMRRLARILAGFAASPGGRLADIDMLTGAERTQLLYEWNATARPYPTGLCVHNMFKRQVAANPDKVAVVYGDRSVSYRALDERAARWASRLRRLGVGPDRLVGIHVQRGPEMVEVLLGVLKAGGAYVPLDPAYPFDRLAFMARDARLTALVTDRVASGDVWSELPCPVLSLDGSTLVTGKEAATPGDDAEPPQADHLAYVLYTSGSTGRPNGVAITHRNAVDLLHWVEEVFADDLGCVLATTSICFDCSILEIFGPLCWGGTTVLADSALDLRSLPAGRQVRLMHTVPSVMAELLRGGGPPPTLRTVILGGESPWPALIKELRERHIERIFNLYGPTEVTSYATAALIDKDGLTIPPSIGRPVANTEIYLLDPYGNPVPVGVPGELYVAGAGLARGYLHQPARTAERFVPNRFGKRPGTRVYRTGDLARYRPDGAIVFLGRVDDQLKVRGVRIEPGEVEQALLRHPAVTDAIVLARPGAEGAAGLSGFVAVAGPPIPEAELRDHLRALLPPYLIPDVLVAGELPRLPNGKVDRQALRLGQPLAESTRPRSYVAPRGPAEDALARLWEGLLGLGRVGVEDNFFEVGGTSFLAIRMIGAAAEIGLEFTVTDVLQYQTVAELAAVARSRGDLARDELGFG